jgi:hypothetical protein
VISRPPKPWTVWLAKAADGGVKAMAKLADRSVSAEAHRLTAEDALVEVDRIMTARTRMEAR